MEVIHRPVRGESVGKVDAWGYGSRSSVIEWPTLPGSPWHLRRSTTGAVLFPSLPGTVVRADTGAECPWDLNYWSQTGTTDGAIVARECRAADGRTYRPEVLADGEEVIIERS